MNGHVIGGLPGRHGIRGIALMCFWEAVEGVDGLAWAGCLSEAHPPQQRFPYSKQGLSCGAQGERCAPLLGAHPVNKKKRKQMRHACLQLQKRPAIAMRQGALLVQAAAPPLPFALTAEPTPPHHPFSPSDGGAHLNPQLPQIFGKICQRHTCYPPPCPPPPRHSGDPPLLLPSPPC